MILPNFIFIGPGSSGTTWLYHILIQHPDIFLKPSKSPEPHFFARESEYVRGLEYYSATYFLSWTGQHAVGEASVSTFYFERAAERLRKHLPNIRLMCILRHPVDRMFSEYWRSLDRGWEDLSFEGALRKEEERLANPPDGYHRDFEPRAYTARGFYHRYLQMWYQHFPKQQIKVILFDDLVRTPEAVAKSVFGFLGVDESFRPVFSETHQNKSSRAQHHMLPDTRRHLLSLYVDANQELAELIGRDLTSWNVGLLGESEEECERSHIRNHF